MHGNRKGRMKSFIIGVFICITFTIFSPIILLMLFVSMFQIVGGCPSDEVLLDKLVQRFM